MNRRPGGTPDPMAGPSFPRRGLPWPAVGVAATAFIASCSGPQSALDPSGPAASRIAELYWILAAISAVVFLLVCALLVVALFRRHHAPGEPPPLPLAPGARGEEAEEGESADEPLEIITDTVDSDRRSVRWVVIGGVLMPIVVLTAALVFTLHTLGALHAEDDAPADLTIEVIGWQWWWEIRYLGPGGEPLLETANEIHIPVGQRVRLRLDAGDVIHSFWVPRLAGKLDMIPGRTNQLWIEADEAGVYRGQCAEYCAGPHALMALLVIAEPKDDFREWIARERRPATGEAATIADTARLGVYGGANSLRSDMGLPSTPARQAAAESAARDTIRGMVTSTLQRGREVFLTNCGMCHAVRGTRADGEAGPDLTHVASRRTLGAVTTPNTFGHLGGWIANPQEIKPGNKMPAMPLTPEEFRAVLHYVQSLK